MRLGGAQEAGFSRLPEQQLFVTQVQHTAAEGPFNPLLNGLGRQSRADPSTGRFLFGSLQRHQQR